LLHVYMHTYTYTCTSADHYRKRWPQIWYRLARKHRICVWKESLVMAFVSCVSMFIVLGHFYDWSMHVKYEIGWHANIESVFENILRNCTILILLLMCHCIDVSMYWSVIVLMCHCIDVSLYWCVIVFMCHCIHVSMYSCVNVFMCQCIHVSMYWCVIVLMCHCIDVSMYSCVNVFMCHCIMPVFGRISWWSTLLLYNTHTHIYVYVYMYVCIYVIAPVFGRNSW
jgi:hypothetical protein